VTRFTTKAKGEVASIEETDWSPRVRRLYHKLIEQLRAQGDDRPVTHANYAPAFPGDGGYQYPRDESFCVTLGRGVYLVYTKNIERAEAERHDASKR